jgi:hypothetical protein
MDMGCISQSSFSIFAGVSSCFGCWLLIAVVGIVIDGSFCSSAAVIVGAGVVIVDVDVDVVGDPTWSVAFSSCFLFCYLS